MNWQRIVVPIAGAVLVAAAWRAYGWAGVAVAVTGVVMWVLKRAGDRPVGYVGSAVMLNAKLRPGVNLLHVVAITRALGELLTEKDAQPEIYRWTDGTQSSVTCEFRNGKLVKWELVRPPAPVEPPEATEAPAP